MADPRDYGLPGVPALDSPYGLPARQPMPIAAPPALAMLPMAQRATEAINTGIGYLARGSRPQAAGGNVTPFRTSPATRAPNKNPQGDFPIVGQNVTLDQLVKLQRNAESSGNYTALNRERKGNTASGAYQYTDSTWNNYGGYAKAMLAPPAIQDKRFAEDVARRVTQYNGDLFKALAAHYLPVQADSPDQWTSPARVRTRGGYVTVKPVASYLRQVLKGTPYEKQLDAYLNAAK